MEGGRERECACLIEERERRDTDTFICNLLNVFPHKVLMPLSPGLLVSILIEAQLPIWIVEWIRMKAKNIQHSVFSDMEIYFLH